MSDTNVIPFGAAVAGDVLSALSIPGGNTLASVATGYLAKKRKAAAELLMTEIAAGKHGPVNFEEHDIEPLIDVILRFSKAVADGAARENLVLLAQIIAGLKKHRAFDSDKFRRWCKIVEGLSRDELLVIGLACQAEKATANDGEKAIDNFSQMLRDLLQKAGFGEKELEALLTSVGSTGLLSSASAWGGLAYQPTPWLGELAQLADVELHARASRDQK